MKNYITNLAESLSQSFHAMLGGNPNITFSARCYLERALAQNDWDNRLTFERDNPRLQAIAAALDIDLDEMFILAAAQ